MFHFFVLFTAFYVSSHLHWYQGKRWSWLMVGTSAAIGISAHIIAGIIIRISSSDFSQLTPIRAERALLSALCSDVAAEHRRIALIFLFYHCYYCFIYFIIPICLSFERFIYTNIFSCIIQLVYINLEFFQFKLAIFSQVSIEPLN